MVMPYIQHLTVVVKEVVTVLMVDNVLALHKVDILFVIDGVKLVDLVELMLLKFILINSLDLENILIQIKNLLMNLMLEMMEECL